jgi:methionyl-tRNA formyltransferase
VKPALLFMGTPEFAVPCLQALIDQGYPIALVVTQPDKPVGRKQVLTAPPVKQLALAHGLEVFQPARIRNQPEVLERLRSAGAELFVVVAYGKILPQDVLDLPVRGCLNVHASLLPAYRGSAPIQWSIVRGETVTGVTTMLMDAGMDTGDMLLKREITIEAEDTGITLAEKLSQLGAELLCETLPLWLSGELQPQVQNPAEATVIPLLKKEDGLLNWQESALALYNRIRGLKPWPETYTFFEGQPLKIKTARVSEQVATGLPGQILAVGKQTLSVATGEGVLEVLRVHPANGKEMNAADFARGHHLLAGVVLG